MSPLAVLGRGYSIVQHEGAVVRSIQQVKVGQQIEVRVSDGALYCGIEQKGSGKSGRKKADV